MVPRVTIANYGRDFATPPSPLTPSQRRLVWFTTIAVALSRPLALSKTLWDWDEALFTLAMRDYDVVQHHPHPPGYPLFIAFAHALRPLAGSDFFSLQLVTLLGAMALFPALFFLARELRIDFATALLGALLFAFLPNVWFYGGTAFSDVPATALTFAACALLLRGCRSRGAYVGGAAMLAIAAGFRPQSLMIALLPALLATAFRARDRMREVIAAALLGAAIVAASYGGAALASQSVSGYREAVREQRDYVMRVDSYRNPTRPPLATLARDAFLYPMRGRNAARVTALLALAGFVVAIARRRWELLFFTILFAPFALFVWLMLDLSAVSRYAVGYVAIHALLAASLLALLGRAGAIVVCGLAAYFGFWAWPALLEVRNEPSPPVAAMEWIRANVPRDSGRVQLAATLAPFGDAYLAGWQVERPNLPGVLRGPHEVFVSDAIAPPRNAQHFFRPHDRLWGLARPRYFNVVVVPLANSVTFGDGWYTHEARGRTAWRWMGRRSTCVLPALPRGTSLTLTMYAPLDALPEPPQITVTIGDVVDRFTPSTATFSRSYEVKGNRLTIETSETVRPPGDARELGLRLEGLQWVRE